MMKIDCTGQDLTRRGEAFTAIQDFVSIVRSGCHQFTVERVSNADGSRVLTITTSGMSINQATKKAKAEADAKAEAKEVDSLKAEVAALKKQLLDSPATKKDDPPADQKPAKK